MDRAGTVRQNVDLPDCISADVVADDVTTRFSCVATCSGHVTGKATRGIGDTGRRQDHTSRTDRGGSLDVLAQASTRGRGDTLGGGVRSRTWAGGAIVVTARVYSRST